MFGIHVPGAIVNIIIHIVFTLAETTDIIECTGPRISFRFAGHSITIILFGRARANSGARTVDRFQSNYAARAQYVRNMYGWIKIDNHDGQLIPIVPG